MGSKGFDVSRVRNGVLDKEHEGRIPPDGRLIVVEGDDHFHVVYGSEADMADYDAEMRRSQQPTDAERVADEEHAKLASKPGLEAPPERKKATAPRKRTATRKKSTARKSTAKKKA